MHAETPVKLGIETELDQTHVDAALAGKVALAKGNNTPVSQGKKLGYHFEVAFTPYLKPGEMPKVIAEGGWGFNGLVKAKSQDVAVEFLKYMLTKEGQRTYSQIYGGRFSPFIPLQGDFSYFTEDEAKAYYTKYLKNRLPEYTYSYGTGFGYVSDLGKHVADAASGIRTGKLNSEQAAKQTQERMEAAYKQYLEDVKKITN